MTVKPSRHMPAMAVGMAALLAAASPGALAATQSQIDQAIQDGLAWLATQQNGSGSFGASGGAFPLAWTAAAVLAFENEGHFPGGGTLYSGNVERGLDFILSNARLMAIGPQPAGDPDSDGDGIGVSWWDQTNSREVYETGMIMQALIASSTPNRVVTSGGPCHGWTYRQVMEDVVDWAAFGQVDAGAGRGGWRYWANYGNSDNSTAQWPVLGLVAAEQWGIHAPQFVKDELNLWIDYIQNDASGGSGYDQPDYLVNESKTGGLLVQMMYVGDDRNTARAQAAIGYLNAHWAMPPNSWDGNKGQPYAMFSIFKGLELMGVTTIPNAPAPPQTTPAGDWYGDYTDHLVQAQNADGSWSGYSSWDQWLATGWYIVILQATVFPVEVDLDLPDCACDGGYAFDVTWSVERFPADGTLTVLEDGVAVAAVTLDDFQGTATQTFLVEEDTPGAHAWRAVLVVTSEGGAEASAEDQGMINVCETPQVAGIPDQVAPFQTFDLDDYLTYGGGLPISWAVSGVPPDWSVSVDAANEVAITAPPGASDPVNLTFTVSVACCAGVVCASSDIATFVPNQPPDCSGAFASTAILWPPNHRWVPIEVLGVVDPDGDAVVITVNAIWQDEPVDTSGDPGGDGSFTPDGAGVGGSVVLVRAERCGSKQVPGNGRVYHLAFTADDGRGGICQGEVLVGVPHDVRDIPVDDGALFDSTALLP
ncbi:MAG: hypothetical protein H7A46_13200 [Verrucomicrobiales bacterium]|nr:hypothetical protein [Verrucomicrobiales bacterium]